LRIIALRFAQVPWPVTKVYACAKRLLPEVVGAGRLPKMRLAFLVTDEGWRWVFLTIKKQIKWKKI